VFASLYRPRLYVFGRLITLPHSGIECRTVSLEQSNSVYSNVGLPVPLIGICTGKVEKKDQTFLDLFL